MNLVMNDRENTLPVPVGTVLSHFRILRQS